MELAKHVAEVSRSHLDSGRRTDLYETLMAAALEETFQVLHLWLYPRQRFGAELRGEAHIRRALKDRRGVIIWVAPFFFSPLITKIALSEQGLLTHHLYRPEHGFSESVFGVRYLNPIRTVSEGRFLQERIVIHPGGEARAKTRIKEVLSQNGIVSIAASGQASRPCRRPFLDGYLSLAVGPMKIAYETGAAILPSFTVPNERGGFDVFVEEPVPIDDSRSFAANMPDFMDCYMARLEAVVLEHPAMLKCWNDVTAAARDTGRDSPQS